MYEGGGHPGMQRLQGFSGLCRTVPRLGSVLVGLWMPAARFNSFALSALASCPLRLALRSGLSWCVGVSAGCGP